MTLTKYSLVCAISVLVACDKSPATDCDDPGAVRAGASCTGSFTCNGDCSDNWPVGEQCEFGCDRFSCIDGTIEQTESTWLDECWMPMGDAGVDGDTRPVTSCDDSGALSVGTPCSGSFTCNGICSDNWPVGDRCEFGCDRFSCLSGTIEQTEMTWLDECWTPPDAGVSDGGGSD